MPDASESPRSIFAANVDRIGECEGLTQEQLGWAAGLHQDRSGEDRERRMAADVRNVVKLVRGLEVPAAAQFSGID